MQGGGRKRPPAKTGVQSKPFVILASFSKAVRFPHLRPRYGTGIEPRDSRCHSRARNTRPYSALRSATGKGQ